ncbi:MAG: DUF167 domain-containing protein [Pseudomonadota bacterium]
MRNWLQVTGESAQLLLYVQPGAKATEIAGIHGGAIKVRVAAAAIDGKANKVLCAFFAKTFNVPVRNIQIWRGEKSRRKTLSITVPDNATLEKLEQLGQ